MQNISEMILSNDTFKPNNFTPGSEVFYSNSPYPGTRPIEESMNNNNVFSNASPFTNVQNAQSNESFIKEVDPYFGKGETRNAAALESIMAM